MGGGVDGFSDVGRRGGGGDWERGGGGDKNKPRRALGARRGCTLTPEDLDEIRYLAALAPMRPPSLPLLPPVGAAPLVASFSPPLPSVEPVSVLLRLGRYFAVGVRVAGLSP